jgi:ankyrin repeat protein
MLAEIGCGCIVTEGSEIENVLVAHVIGDFRPLWSFLRHFADCFMIEDSTVEAESFFSSFMTEEKKREMDSEDDSLRVATNKSIWKPSHGRQSIKQNEYKEDDYEGPPPSENDRKTEMLDLINILTVVVESRHPLFTLILLENTPLFDAITKGGKYNMGMTQYRLTLLNFAIMSSTTKMVRHLLEDPMNADPSTPDGSGMNALHLAVIATKEMEIIDLLLANSKVKVDDADEHGQTALHLAAYLSNDIAVQKLIENGANPNVLDKKGLSPLHVAAKQRDGNPIIDLLLEAQKFKGMDDVNDRNERGETALHYAAFKSNEITAEHLIKKGADLHYRNNDGLTPLHMAATHTKDMKIIDLLLKNIREEEIDQYQKDAMLLRNAYCNKHDLGDEIMKLLVAKEMASKKQVQNPRVLEELNAAKQQDKLRHSKSSNEYGLGGAMANLMEKKGAAVEAGTERYKQPNRHIPSMYEKIREINNFKAKIGGIAHIIGDNTVKMEDKVGMVFTMTLVNAIMNSDVKTIRKLLKEFRADISTLKWEEQRCNALHLASEFAKTTNLIDFILETDKFDINRVDLDGWTALHYALVGSNAAINARHLLKKGADPTLANKNGITPFHVAAETCVQESDILDLFLANNYKFDINQRNQSAGITALHIAIATSNLTTSRFLLSKGANPNVADENGFTPLHLAADFAKDLDIVKLLLNHQDTNVNLLDNKGNNALYYAKMNMHGIGEEIANLLTVQKSVAKAAEGSDHEPENIAALVPVRIEEDSKIKTIRILIESGMDITTMRWGENGTNALHVTAADAKTTDLIDVIVETGKFDINGIDNNGLTPLHHAMNGSVSTTNVPRLIQLGANPSIADKNGVTALHVAARNADSMDLIELLLNTEAVDVNCVDKQGRTPLNCARSNKHGLGERIVNRLRESGANEW